MDEWTGGGKDYEERWIFETLTRHFAWRTEFRSDLKSRSRMRPMTYLVDKKKKGAVLH